MMASGKPFPGAPVKFRFVVEQFEGLSFAITWDVDRLLLQESETGYPGYSKKSERSPSQEQWSAFWSSVESLGVWQWRCRYEHIALDGTSWTLELDVGDRKVVCRGSNSYPPNNTLDPSVSFRELITALGELTGSREFVERWSREDY